MKLACYIVYERYEYILFFLGIKDHARSMPNCISSVLPSSFLLAINSSIRASGGALKLRTKAYFIFAPILSDLTINLSY